MCIPTVPITLRRLLTRTLSLRTSAVVSSVRTAPIVDEHVVRPVGVPGHEVGSYRLEGDEPAVGADRRIRAMAAVRLVREAVDAHPLGGAGNAVVDEHVRGGVVEAIHVLGPVGVPGHEVGGGRGEGHEAAVGAERGRAATPVPLIAGAVHAHPLGGAGLSVVDEHVGRLVGVPGARLVASEAKATKRPSALIARRSAEVPTLPLPPSPWFPALSTLTRSVIPVCRSRTNTS